MSPASQGALEVERYIGSCLISSSVRSPTCGKTLITGIAKKQQQHQQQQQLQEAVSLRGKQRGDYAQQGNYIGNGEQCQYGTWAGAPLFSMTSSPRKSNQRSSPPPCQNQQQQTGQQQQQGQQIQTHMQNQSPLSQLAIHTQGAPLILAGRFHNRGKIQSTTGMNGTTTNNSGMSIPSANVNRNSNSYCNGNNANALPGIGNSMIGSAVRCVPARGQRLIDTTRKPQQQLHKPECSNGKVDGANIANIDSLSIASDESSGSNNSENSLPRIIKPRKRRKKDRKPAGSGAVITEIPCKTDDHQQQKQQQQQQQTNQQQQQHHQNHPNATVISEQSSIVTLKPYVPICYETRYEQHRGHRRPPPIGRESYPRSQNQNVSCNGPMQMGPQQMHHQQQEIVDTRQQPHHHHHQQQQQQRYSQRHVQVKVLDDNRNVVVPTSTPSMLGRSMSLAPKGITANSPSNYHNRNHHHHVAHHHHHHHHHHNEAKNGNNPATMVGNGSGIVNSLPRHRYPPHQQHQPPHEYNEPMLMGCDENASRVDAPPGSLGSAGCQCRYCDPSGLIWDVDQHGYSPFLTPPHSSEFPVTPDYGVSQQQQQFAHLPLFLSRNGPAAITCQEQQTPSTGCEYFELTESSVVPSQRSHQHHHNHSNNNNHNNNNIINNNNNNTRHQISHLQDPRCRETAGACTGTTANNSCNAQPTSAVTMLRRSWSDPTSYFSDEISVPNRDVGVIGDRGLTEMPRGRSSWPGSAASGLTSGTGGNSPYGNLTNLPVTSQGLEVSTEIVTSPNGHRDLEIKFYSSSPSVLPVDDDNKTPFLDDGEDFSDIWSYHESKLQQDFRTLLQAEE